MLPSLMLMAYKVFEWSSDQGKTSLLVEALVCLVMGVVCGLFIVKSVMSSEDAAEDTKDAPRAVKPQMQHGDDLASATVPAPPLAEAHSLISTARPDSGTLEEAYAKIYSSKADAPGNESLSAAGPIAEVIALPPANSASAELPAADFSFDPQLSGLSETVSLDAEAPLSVEVALAQVSAPAPGDELPAGPQFDGLFDALQAAVPTSHTLDKPTAPRSYDQSNPPTLKVEIALTGPDRSTGGNRDSYDSLKVEFAVKAQDESSSETRAVVKSLEEKVARIEAVAAKLEAAGRPDQESEADSLPDTAAPENDTRPRKFGTRELVRPLPAFQTVEQWLEYAAHLEEKSNFDDAIKCYDKVAALDPGNFLSWFRKATVLRKKGCYEDALYCMNYALRIDTRHSGALTEKGVCMNMMGRHDQAMTWFEKALGAETDFVPALIGKARCLAAMGKHKEALPIYDKALRNDPGNMDARRGREESAAKCPK
ncbi:MAG: tetratricopeptide repeat protein [Candidatus Obscuribacterales bacterium]|nr:tetratricopeptide repeat protein [Candidatus Obscuribacterales bacterium]